MKKLLFILLLTIPFIGFGQEGLVKGYYENGQLRYEKNYKDGKLNGLTKIYLENGQLNLEGNYKDGKMNGYQKKWYENGQLKHEYNYKGGFEGLFKTYDEKGKLKSVSIYIDNKYISQICWDENGKKIECE